MAVIVLVPYLMYDGSEYLSAMNKQQNWLQSQPDLSFTALCCTFAG